MLQKSKIPLLDILKIIGVILTLVFLFLLRDIILMFLVALILAISLTRPVNWLQAKRVPRLLAAILIYLLGLGLFAFLVYLIFPPLVSQIKSLTNNLPEYLRRAQQYIIGFRESWSGEIADTTQRILEQWSLKLGSLASGVLPALRTIFGRLFYTLIVIVVSFYLTLQGPRLKIEFLKLIPAKYKPRLTLLTDRIQRKMRRWLYGQLFLGLVVGVLIFIGLYILGIRYALFLAILAAFLEMIPTVGPILAAIPAIALGFLQNPILAIFVILLYIGVQQLENHLIVPQVMKRAVGLNPLIVILALLVGLKLAGILGAILAVPIAAGLTEVVREMMRKT